MNRRQVLTYGAFGLGASALAPGLAWARPHSAPRQVERDRSSRSSSTPPLASPGSAIARTNGSSARRLPGRTPCLPVGSRMPPGGSNAQAARFRLYGLDRDGEVVAEVTAADADIQLDRPSRQHQSRLVHLRHRPRHSPGQRASRRAAASRARSDALPPPQRGDHRSREIADRPRAALDRRGKRECRRARCQRIVRRRHGSSTSRSRLASCGPMTRGACSSSAGRGAPLRPFPA